MNGARPNGDPEDMGFKVVGTEADGTLIYEDVATGERYTDGLTLADFGEQYLFEDERAALNLD